MDTTTLLLVVNNFIFGKILKGKKILGLKNYVLGKCEVTVHVQQKYQGTKSAFKCF